VEHVTLDDLRAPARLLARVHALRAERWGMINAR
jgi:hypothetical protein